MGQTDYKHSLAEAEERRLNLQAEFDNRRSASERNRLGQFATPPVLAWDILELAGKHLGAGHPSIRFLDPAIGTGVFFSALMDTFDRERIQKAVGFEIDDDLAAVSNELWNPFGLKVRHEDFTQVTEPDIAADKFNLLVCNPPYVRHHWLDDQTKDRLKRRIVQKLAVSVNGLAGLYSYFMLLADLWLADDGVALWLVPGELLDVNYGMALRQYLTSKVALCRIHRFAPEDVQFANALVSSCVIVYEKRPCTSDQEVELTYGGTLLNPEYSAPTSIAELRRASKWGYLVRGSSDSEQGVDLPDRTFTVESFFAVKRGAATGANGFFILELERAKALGLPEEFLLPILPSPRYITCKRIEADVQGWPLIDPRLALLSCDLPRHVVRELYPTLDEYLQSGEASGLTERYLLRSRKPWYRQENRPPAPILCTYMGRRKTNTRVFRFFRNYSDATAPNVYLMLYPKPWLREVERQVPGILDQLFLALQQASDQMLVNQGRTYGGGLSKLEPRELARLRLEVEPESVRRFGAKRLIG